MHFHKSLTLFISLGGLTLIHADTISLFDGKTLDGWLGDKTFWSVQNGVINGESTPANPCKRSSYLTYTSQEFSNFELTFSFRFLSQKGNSGVQYRSRWKNQPLHQISGYQADMETGSNYSGILYEQDGRGIVAKRGQHVTISADGKKKISPIKGAENAQGLCWAFGSLYMTCHSNKGGVYRLTDTNNDGQFDQTELILPVVRKGEHGPHGLVKSADGQGLLLILGNHTPAVKNTTSVSNANWSEDTLHPHLPDSSGHAHGIKAPGGTLLRISPDGKKREIFATGV